jgi:hypothetical protein
MPKLPFITLLDWYFYASIIFVLALIYQCAIVSEAYSDGISRTIIFYFDLGVWIFLHIIYLILCCYLGKKQNLNLDTFPTVNYAGGHVE